MISRLCMRNIATRSWYVPFGVASRFCRIVGVSTFGLFCNDGELYTGDGDVGSSNLNDRRFCISWLASGGRSVLSDAALMFESSAGDTKMEGGWGEFVGSVLSYELAPLVEYEEL